MEDFLLNNKWVIYLAILWTIPLKGIALYKAARKEQKVWFVLILLLNTLGILELLYIFFFSKAVKEKSFKKV